MCVQSSSSMTNQQTGGVTTVGAGGRLSGVRPAPAEITFKNLRFLITDRPTDAMLQTYITELKRRNVRDVVRVCEPTYNTEALMNEGIRVLDLEFDDGTAPSVELVEKWLDLLRTRFKEEPGCCVAVHCVAGLGRAPVLVALALMEQGMKFEDAVELIRQKRRGAINTKQLTYLERYRPKSRLKLKSNGHKASCSVM